MDRHTKKPLLEKLGFKQDQVSYVDSFAPYFQDVEAFITLNAPTPYDFIHIFVQNRAELEKSMQYAYDKLGKIGMIWVSWPKKSSGADTDLSDRVVREFGLQLGLVDVKVAAVDDYWSALKFVHRVRDR